MKRLLLLPLLALPLLFVGCDGEPPTEPTSHTDALFDVTIAGGRVTNTIQLKYSCAAGYTGAILYQFVPASPVVVSCPGGTVTVDATGVTGIKLLYGIDGQIPSCGNIVDYSVGDLPIRDKCTVNGRDAGPFSAHGKSIAKITVSYVNP